MRRESCAVAAVSALLRRCCMAWCFPVRSNLSFTRTVREWCVDALSGSSLVTGVTFPCYGRSHDGWAWRGVGRIEIWMWAFDVIPVLC